MRKLNVFRRRCLNGEKLYRSAVSQIINDLQHDHGLSNTQIADIIGCNKDTISNAKNGKVSLSGYHLVAIGQCFGGEALIPFALLIDQPKPEEAEGRIALVVEKCAELVAKFLHLKGRPDHTQERSFLRSLKGIHLCLAAALHRGKAAA